MWLISNFLTANQREELKSQDRKFGIDSNDSPKTAKRSDETKYKDRKNQNIHNTTEIRRSTESVNDRKRENKSDHAHAIVHKGESGRK